jgi:FeS assembly SUF system protein
MSDEPVEAPAPAVPPDAERTEGNRIVPNVSEALPADEVARITTDLIGALKTVYDPEIPIDIYELGLIYKVDLDDNRNLTIDMTLTAPGCGMGDILVDDVRSKLERVPTVAEADVELTFDPPWNHAMMSDVAKLETGML